MQLSFGSHGALRKRADGLGQSAAAAYTRADVRCIRKHYLLGDREAMHISGPALRGTRRRGREKPPYNDSADDGPLKEWAVFLLMLMRGGPLLVPGPLCSCGGGGRRAKDAGSF